TSENVPRLRVGTRRRQRTPQTRGRRRLKVGAPCLYLMKGRVGSPGVPMTRRFNLPALALVVAIPFLTCRQALAEADSAPEPGVDVQPRGPVHEAFAKATAPNAEPGAVVP